MRYLLVILLVLATLSLSGQAFAQGYDEDSLASHFFVAISPECASLASLIDPVELPIETMFIEPDRYRVGMYSMGQWHFSIDSAIKIFDPEPKDLDEEEARSGFGKLTLRGMILKDFRPLRFEMFVSHALTRHWRIEGDVFESWTNLNYPERLATGVQNEHAYGVAIFVSRR